MIKISIAGITLLIILTIANIPDKEEAELQVLEKVNTELNEQTPPENKATGEFVFRIARLMIFMSAIASIVKFT